MDCGALPRSGSIHAPRKARQAGGQRADHAMLTTMSDWNPIEITPAGTAARGPGSFLALAEGRVPAVIVRGAFPVDQCRAVVRRLYDRGVILERKGQTYDAVG